MLNFSFHNPTKIVFGKDRIPELDKLVPKDAKILITYGGGSVEKFGTLEKVEAALGDRNFIKFKGIEPNPKFETLVRAAEIVKSEGIDFILAVGGGSVIDGTKFIALVANYDGDPADVFNKGGHIVPKATSFGAVLTLPATGSEMNAGGVITKGHLKRAVFSQFTYPKFSILDPTLTYTLPSNQVANGIIDTFVHVLEQYVTYPVDAKFQDRTAEGILQSLVEIGKTTIDNPTDYDSHANLVWCATMALNGLIGAGVPGDWSTHTIGHEITAHFGLDHAVTLAIMQPAIWRVRLDKKMAKLAQYGRRVFYLTGSDEEVATAAIDKTEEFFNSLGVATKLSAYGIKEEDFHKILGNLEENGATAISESGDLTLDIV
jgi:NADP-dependent alcohol dehydrogenase